MLAASPSRDWLDFVSVLTPSVIALAVAYIAYRQWRIARQKLRLDLYAKRFAAFEATLCFYQELLAGSTSDKARVESLHRQFITAMIESRFLFDPDSGLKALMETFNKSAFVILGSRDLLRTGGGPSELVAEARSRLNSEQTSIVAQLEAIEKAMSPYLSFRGHVD